MNDFLLPTGEDSIIRLTFKDGQEPIEVDLIDLQFEIDRIKMLPKKEELDIGREFAKYLQETHDRKVSRTAAVFLIELVYDKWQELKLKNSNGQGELKS